MSYWSGIWEDVKSRPGDMVFSGIFFPAFLLTLQWQIAVGGLAIGALINLWATYRSKP